MAIVIGVVFVWRQLKAKEPVLDFGLFRYPAYAAGTTIVATQNFAMYALLFELPQFFERFRGTPPREIGYTLFSMMVGMVFLAPVGGRITDHLGARKAGLIGTGCLLAGGLLLCRMASFATPHDAIPSLLLIGAGLGLCSAPAQSSSMSAVKPSEAGMAAGVSSAMRYVGGVCGVLVLGAVLGGNDTVSEARHVAMAWIYVVAIILSGIACLRLPGRHASGHPSA